MDCVISENKDAYKNMITLIDIPMVLPTRSLTVDAYQTLIQYDDIKLYENDIKAMSKSISECVSKYIFPTVLTKFCKRYVDNPSVRIKFTNEHLRELQIWCNQYREHVMNDSDDICSKAFEDQDIKDYLIYKVCCNIVQFALMDNNLKLPNQFW